MTPRVFNRNVNSVPIPLDAVYVGRAGPFGNPFKIGPDGTRAQVIEKFRAWVSAPGQLALRETAKKALRGHDLVCWCAPAPCHADVWLEIVNTCELCEDRCCTYCDSGEHYAPYGTHAACPNYG